MMPSAPHGQFLAAALAGSEDRDVAITLTSDDLTRLGKATQVLVAPFDHPSTDAWRLAVNRATEELLGADSAGFLLPVDGSLALLSEEHDPSQLAAYPTLLPPPLADGTPIFQRAIQLGVSRLVDAYGESYRSYMDSAYFNEYAKPNRACDTLAAMISLGGADPTSVASLQYWHDSTEGRQFSEREVELLRLLFPAFRAGVEAHVQWRKDGADLLGLMDRLGAAAMVYSVEGRVLHETPAIQRMLASEPEAQALRAASANVASTLRGVLGALGWTHSREIRPLTPVAEVSAGRVRYAVRGWLQRAPHGEREYVILVAIERSAPETLSDEQLQGEFFLTRAEVSVARLLAEGLSNTEMARRLGVSPHTVRRHTEQVFRKLDVRARAGVAVRLQR